MRALVAVCFVGCAGPHHEPVVEPIDAPTDAPADAIVGASCSSAGDTANVVVQAVGPAKVYDRAYAGGTLVGSGVSSVPFLLHLVFANQSPVPVCCTSPDSSCCGIDALSADVELLLGGELGDHAANVAGVGFTTMGTLTITDWIQPFDVPPGHIAGSLSVSTGTVSIDGTFDNVFCAEMLAGTI